MLVEIGRCHSGGQWKGVTQGREIREKGKGGKKNTDKEQKAKLKKGEKFKKKGKVLKK